MPVSHHIVIASSYLHVPGGYEKMVISTAGLFVEKGHQVTILILDHTAATYYPVHPEVKIVHLPMNFGITSKGNTISRKINMWKDTRKLKQIIKQLRPDMLICTEYPFAVCAILAGAKKICKVSSWEHHHFRAQRLNRFWQYLLRRTYPKLDAVICLNADEQQYYKQFNRNAVVIPNFIAPAIPIPVQPEKYDLVTVTRFNHIKGIDLLMEVAKKLLPPNPEIKWKVIGYGEQQDVFLGFIKSENLSDQLIFQPADKTDLTKEYREAKLFVMTSRNECFPLVLLEAMSNRLPCIAFDCDTGPRHIIINNQTGLLVNKENTVEMVNAIRSLLDDPGRMQTMGLNSQKAVQAYYPNKIYELWGNLLR